MGMDYTYAGSASYPRFDEEVYEIVKLFGGIKSEKLQQRENSQSGIDYWFGSMSSADANLQKYTFPDNTNVLLVKWFNNIYDEYTPEETQAIYHEILKLEDKIEEISSQILYELNQLCLYKEGWDIS